MSENLDRDTGDFKAWFKCFPRDWRDGTGKLTPEQRGVYIDCLCYLYEFERPIPSDDKWVAHHFHISARLWRSVRDALVKAGKLVPTDGGWTNVRAEFEIESRRNQSRTKRESAANRERKRREFSENENKNNEATTTAVPQKDHYARPCQIPDTRIQKEISNSSVLTETAREPLAALPSDFENRLIEVAQPCLDNPVNCQGLLNASVPRMWVTQGCDIELDIFPALKAAAVKHKGKRIRDWSYFTAMIGEARAKRLAGVPAIKIESKSKPASTFARPPRLSENDEYEATMRMARDMGIIDATAH